MQKKPYKDRTCFRAAHPTSNHSLVLIFYMLKKSFYPAFLENIKKSKQIFITIDYG